MKVAALFCLAMLPVFGNDEAPAPPTSTPLEQALPVLRSGYVDFARLQILPADRLDTVVARCQGEVTLVQPGALPVAPVPILAALLPEQVIYCRASSFQPASSWSDLGGEVAKWIGQGADGFILDLRSNGAPDDFDGAARLAGLFTAPGTPLFDLRDARQSLRPYASLAPAGSVLGLPISAPLVILTNGRTVGAGEALAATLRQHGALVIGQATSGRGGVFAEAPLTDGVRVRYLAGEVVLSDGTVLWGHPVAPDISVVTDVKKEQAALALIGQEHLADVIGEAAQRHRMSEASLVRGEDPEIDSSILPAGAKAPLSSSALDTQDVVLVDAIDSLKAIRFSQRTDAAPAAGTGPAASPVVTR
jgi:hypothetical protein